MRKTSKPRVNYITIEDPGSGLFRTQVLDLIGCLTKTASAEISLCIFIYPWHLFSRRRCLSQLLTKCGVEGISVHIYPVLVPVKFSLMSGLWFKLGAAWLIVIAQLLPKSDIAHCRGYFATFIGIKSRPKCKVVFDTRSSWVDENVAAGRLTAKSNLHTRWLKFEQYCLRKADYTIGVSDAMAVVAERGPSQTYETIPIIANRSLLGFSESFRDQMRKRFGWDGLQVAVYSGSLGLNRINQSILTKLLALLACGNDELRFLFLTAEDPNLIQQMVRLAGIRDDTARCFSVSPEKLGDYLSIADFGIHALPTQPDSETRLGTKVVEYWVNGLPTMVTSSVGAAAKITNEFRVGQVLPIDALEGFSHRVKVDTSGLNRANFIQSFEAFDVKQFDIQCVAEKYTKVYELLSMQPVD